MSFKERGLNRRRKKRVIVMSKLTKSEKQEVRKLITFKDGKLINQETLEEDLIKFCNKKYCEKYKSDENYKHIREEKYFNLDGTEVDRTIVLDNELLERVSILLYSQSTKHYRSLGINTKNESYNIEPIGTKDIGQKRQYLPHYQLNGEKIYLVFESINNYSEESKTQWACEQVYAKEYSEVERTIDNAINSLFDKYRVSDNKNEILYRLLVNLNKEQLDYFSYEALVYFLRIELNHYHILDNQQKVLDRILLCGEIPNTQQKKVLKRALNISKKK